MKELTDKGKRAKAASYILATASEQAKNSVLQDVAESLRKEKSAILTANKQDLDAAGARPCNHRSAG